MFKQPELARTLERIAKNPDDFYHGDMARELAAAMQKGGGLITAEDLAAYEVKERQPIRGTYRGYEIISAPPPSSGGVALVEILNILEGYDLAKQGNRSAESIHLTAEAFQRAFFDRTEFLGDPDFSKIPVAQLIDKRYAAAWRETIPLRRATPSGELKRPAIFTQLDQYASTHPQPNAGREPDNTTHYSVVDPEGNAVSVTTTLNDSFGSQVTAEGLGFLMNNEMDDFAAKQGVPNMYGLIQGPANAVGPNKRPLSAMTPTIVLKDGKLFLVLGSPGGPTIITTVANVLMGVVDYGLNIQEAVNAPRFHNQWLPDFRCMAGEVRDFARHRAHSRAAWDTRSRTITSSGAMPSASRLTRRRASVWVPAMDAITGRRSASDAACDVNAGVCAAGAAASRTARPDGVGRCRGD